MSDYEEEDQEDNIEDNCLEEHFPPTLAMVDDDDNFSELLSPSPPLSPPSNKDSIHDLTLQLLLNANNYKKYVSKYQTEKKEPKLPLEDLELYLGNIEEFMSNSIEKILETGDLEYHPIDPMHEVYDSYRAFLSKAIDYYKSLANIKVKKIDQEDDKNYDQLNLLEKEQLTFLKVKKTSSNKKEAHSRLLDSSLKIDTSKLSPLANSQYVPPPPALRRYTNSIHHWP